MLSFHLSDQVIFTFINVYKQQANVFSKSKRWMGLLEAGS